MEIKEIKNILLKNNICKDYLERLAEAQELEKFVGAALTFSGIEYLRKHKDVIQKVYTAFSEYFSGRVVEVPDLGYGSLYIDHNEIKEVEAVADVYYLINSSIILSLQENKVYKIVLDASSRLMMNLSDNNLVFIEMYGSSKLVMLSSKGVNKVSIIRDESNNPIINYTGDNKIIKIVR